MSLLFPPKAKKASEVISTLQALVYQHGDLDVMLWDGDDQLFPCLKIEGPSLLPGSHAERTVTLS